MIPYLFEANATPEATPSGTIPEDFKRFGKGKLSDALSCVIHETLAGEYELTLEYPVSGPLYQDLKNGGVILATNMSYRRSESTFNELHFLQPFDIYRIEENIDGIIKVYARHLIYRIARSALLMPRSDRYDYAGGWARWAFENANPPITYISCKGSPYDNIVYHVDPNTGYGGSGWKFMQSNVATNPFTLLFGNGGVQKAAGYDVFYSMYCIRFVRHRGGDYGAAIRYGKNMLSLDHVIDDSETFNAVMPFWESDDVRVTVTGGIVQPSTPITPIKAVPLDLSSSFDSQPTEAQLTSAALEYLETHTPWETINTIDVDIAILNPFGDVSTFGYRDKGFETAIELGDTVTVYYEALGINKKMRVVEYWYDVIEENYQTLRIGTEQTEFVAVTGDTVSASSAGASGGGSGGGVPAYQPGDTLTLNSYAPFDGLITSSTKSVRFCIPTPKSMANITTITATNLSAELRGAKGYLNSQSGFYDYADRSGYTVTCTKVTDTLFRVNIDKSTAFSNVDNNTLVNALLEATAAFEFQ